MTKRKFIILPLMLVAITAFAERPYNHTIGVNIGSINGLTYKGYVSNSDEFVMLLDANVQLYTNLACAVADPNFLYQNKATSFDFADLYWFLGAGVNAGFAWDFRSPQKEPLYDAKAFKLGQHATLGAELNFNDAPVVLGLDFRPGIGELFYKSSIETIEEQPVILPEPQRYTTIFFDWGLAVSVRFRLDK